MRRQEKAVGGIPAKSVADVIEEPPSAHLKKGALRHAQRAVVPLYPGIGQEKQQIVGRGKFGCVAEAAVFFVEHPAELSYGGGEQRRIRVVPAALVAAQNGDQLLRGAQQPRPGPSPSRPAIACSSS